MKKILSILFIAAFAFNMNAQEGDVLKNKNGVAILPTAGDIGLGVNAGPLLNWFGNSFNNTSNNTYANSSKLYSTYGNPSISLKYMLSDNTAARATFGFDILSGVNNRFVTNDASNNPDSMLVDSRGFSEGVYTLGLGYEMRRGKGKVQGYYGGDFRMSYRDVANNSFTYANAMTLTNITPTTSDWNSAPGVTANPGTRVLETMGGNNLLLGVRPFIGVEYFVAPCVSIGTEFGWTMAYQHTAGTSNYTETFEAATGNMIYEVNKGAAASNAFVANVDNFDAAIFLNFFF
jgi:hypothetical protein